MPPTLSVCRFLPAWFLIALVIFVTPVAKAADARDSKPEFAKGADISWVPGMEAKGKYWYDKRGVKRDILDILKKDYQINAVRIRVWVNPKMDDYSAGFLNAENAAKLAKRAADKKLRVMLDLHYSDSWADPHKQTKPYAWKDDTFEQLLEAVSAHTVYVMKTVMSYGVTPEWVQIGNETNDGMLWEDGRATNHMDHYAQIVTAGTRAVKSVSRRTKTIVHVANGYKNELFRWNIGGLIRNGAEFDIVGLSLYPTKDDWQVKTDKAVENMKDMLASYGKQVMACEIGMDYREEAAAKDFVATIKTKTRAVPHANGLGVFYWEPEALPKTTGHSYKKGAWNPDGKPTTAMEGFLN